MSESMDDDRVSVIMPAYNAAATIDQAITSVVAQTYPHWELLVADDCSPDNTRALIKSWRKHEPRVKLVALDRNGGPARARNAALAAAQGRWLAFLDSDDWWLPRKLEHQLEFQRKKNTAMSYTGFRRVSPDGMQIGRHVPPPASLNYRQALGRTGIPTSSVILDRARTGDVRMKLVYYDDFACWLDVLRTGECSYGLAEDLMRYRMSAGSVSRNKLRSMREVWRQMRGVENLPWPAAALAFSSYSLHAALKYSRF